MAKKKKLGPTDLSFAKEKKPIGKVGAKRTGSLDDDSKSRGETAEGGAEAAVTSSRRTEAIDDRAVGEILETKTFVDRAHRFFRQSSEASKTWRDNYIENMKFLSNDQWRDEDKGVAVDGEDLRPYVVINKTLSPVMTISGIQRQSRQEIKLLPFEPDDTGSTEMMQVLLKWTRDRNKMNREDSKVFVDKIAAGLGFWKLFYDYRRRPQGEVKCSRVNPLNIFWDPNWPECEWGDTEYMIDATWYSLEQAIEEWPKFEKDIRSRFGEWLPADGASGLGGRGELAGDPLSGRREFWDAQTQRVRVLKLWYKELIKSEVAIFKTGDVTADPDEVARIKEVFASMGGKQALGDAVVFTKRPVQFVRVANILDDILLDDEDSPLPFNEFPYVPSVGFYFYKDPFGMVDVMKDPQREKNKRRMAIMEIASRAAHSGFYNKRVGGALREDLENHATGQGVVVEYETERPEKIKPEEIPQVLVMLEQKSDQEINEVVNVNQELLGQTTQATVSGRAIEARQRGGILTQGIFFDTFSEEMEEVARLLIAMIKDNVTVDEAHRVLGSLAKEQAQNDQGQLPEALQGLQGQGVSDVEAVLSRAFSTEYDVVISVKPEDPTHEFAVWQTLLEMAEKVPVPPDLLIEAAIKAGVVDRAAGERVRQALLAQVTGTPRPDAPHPPAPPPGAPPAQPGQPAPGGSPVPVAPVQAQVLSHSAPSGIGNAVPNGV